MGRPIGMNPTLRNRFASRKRRRKPDFPLPYQTYAGLKVNVDGQPFVIIQGHCIDKDSPDPNLHDTTQGFKVAPVLPDGTLGRSQVRVILYGEIQAGSPWKGRA